jgi:hypothetical protein
MMNNLVELYSIIHSVFDTNIKRFMYELSRVDNVSLTFEVFVIPFQ